MNNNPIVHRTGAGPAGRRAGRVPSLPMSAIHSFHQPAIPDNERREYDMANEQPIIHYNDAWESVPLEFVDDVIAFFEANLQATHPLRQYKLFPIAKCWRKYKYLIEEEEPTEKLWVLDMENKKRVTVQVF